MHIILQRFPGILTQVLHYPVAIKVNNMAKQTDTQIEGTFGNKIYYRRKGEYLVREKGNTGKQAAIARKQASILGRASAISASLRKAFKPMLPGPVNRSLMYRFNNALQQWFRSGQAETTVPVNYIPFIQGFSFTADPFYVSMPVNRLANGNLVIQIPAFDSPNPIHPLPFSGQVNLHIMAVTCNVQVPAASVSHETILNISYHGIPIPPQQLTIPVQALPGNLTVVALSVNGMSAGIVGALYN